MSDPQVGQLLPIPYLPTPSQPGGPGTPITDPVQVFSEKNGYYYPGCGHSINSYDVVGDSVGGVPSAIVRCPLCGFIQKIFTPRSLFDNMPGSQVLVA